MTMELDDDGCRSTRTRPSSSARACSWRATSSSTCTPGSPNAAGDRPTDHTFPVNQTSYSVQLDQVLTTLQGDVRADLQIFLNQFGNALVKYGGAEGLNELYRTSAPAYKYTSQVNEALLGTQPGDLEGVIHGLDRVVRGLERNEGTLQNLVTNFRIVTGSFAAEDQALGQAIEALPNTLEAARPAFANLNASFPPLRAFAREALPGVRSTPETLDAATPFIEQVRALVSKPELRGLTADLRPTIPELAQLTHRTMPFLDQARALSSCFNEVVIPWSNDQVDPVSPSGTYPFKPFGRVFEETAYGLSGSRREQVGRRQRPVHPRRGRRRQNMVKIPDAIPSLTGGGLQDAVALRAVPDPRRDAAHRRLGEDAVQAEPAPASARSSRTSRPGSAPASRPPGAAGDGAATCRACCRSSRRSRSRRALRHVGLEARRRPTAAVDPRQDGERQLMRTTIAKHLRDFVAVAALLIVGLVVTVLHRREPAAAHPDPRGEAVRAQGRVPDRPGGRPGPGPDDPRRRRAGRRRLRRSSSRTASRVVTFEIDRKFLPIYQHATVLMRPPPASRTCSSSSTRAPRRPRRVPGGRHDPAGQHRPGRQPRRDSVGARRRHPGLPALLLVGAGQGLDGPRRGPRQAARQPRAHQQGPRAARTARSPSAGRTSPT